jgi:tRNA pseudouridine55 synthase
LIADLGDAYCEELRRTRIGSFDVADADPERVIGLDEALSFLPAITLDEHQARLALHGAAVPGESGEGLVRLTDTGGVLAIAEPRGELMKPLVVLR